MPADYKELYHLMLNASEDALTAMEEHDFVKAHRILVTTERAAEERYLQQTENDET